MRQALVSSRFTQVNKVDLLLLGAVGILVTFGLLMVYDASQVEAYLDFGDKYIYFRQQLVWVFLGIISLGFFSLMIFWTTVVLVKVGIFITDC
jgi:cell division protein FtsW (lipid II flippase)